MEGDWKSLTRKFCLESSILGLKYFYIYPDYVTRCFWAIAMLCILYTAGLLTWLLYYRFEDMPTRITIENQYEPLNNLPHPSIALCSPNQMTISAMEHFNNTLLDGVHTLDLNIILPQMLGFYELVAKVSPDGLAQLQSLITINRYTTLEVMGIMPQSCDQFIRRCFFERKQVENCSQLFQPLITKHGMCCVFNSVYHYKFNKRNEKKINFESSKILKSGLDNALTVVTDYQPDDAMDKTIINAGATRVMIGDWTEFPADYESNLVYAYAESYHILQATYTYCSSEVEQLPTWSRKCYFEEEHILPYFNQYHTSDCDLMCFVSEVERRCGCTMPYVPYLKMTRVCNLTKIQCIVDIKLQLHKWYQADKCLCPRDCVSRRYKIDMTMGNLGALPYLLGNPYKDLIINKSTSVMHFFFPNSVHVKKKQETVMSIISLASNIGGVFGLCLGCSVISVFEVLFFIYAAVRNHVRKRLRMRLEPAEQDWVQTSLYSKSIIPVYQIKDA